MMTPPPPPPTPTTVLKPSSGTAFALEEEEEEAAAAQRRQKQQQQQQQQQNPPNNHPTLIIHNNNGDDDDDSKTKMSILPGQIDLPPPPTPYPLPPPPPAATPPRTTCQSCGAQEKFFLHNVQIKGEIQRLCTSCVLVEHPKSFCASCFDLYDPSPRPPPSKRIRCSTCSSSFVHSHCAPSHPFVCPRCSNPNFSFFDLDSNSKRSITKPMASALLCAAKIAHSSMVKAAASARDDALTKVTNAASSRKRARAALEHVASLSIKHQHKLVKAFSSKKDQLSAAVITLTNHPQIANGNSTFSGFDGSNNNNNNNNGVKIPTFHQRNVSAAAAAAANSNHNNGNTNGSAVKVKEECDNEDGGGGGGGSNGVLNS